MNTDSSTTASNANAVCRSRRSGTSRDHRERTLAPICGIAAPETAAHTCGHGSGQSTSTAAIISSIPAAKMPIAQGSTRLCPHRST